MTGKNSNGQTTVFNHYSDTLIVMGKMVIDTEKVLIDREDFLSVDTLIINQKGLIISSFKLNALALGQNITLSSNSGIISEDMKNVVRNEATKYKFIYLKDILLQSRDGRTCYPSTPSIKIVFKN